MSLVPRATVLAIVATCDVYAGAAQDSSAAAFGTRGITFRARRP